MNKLELLHELCSKPLSEFALWEFSQIRVKDLRPNNYLMQEFEYLAVDLNITKEEILDSNLSKFIMLIGSKEPLDKIMKASKMNSSIYRAQIIMELLLTGEKCDFCVASIMHQTIKAYYEAFSKEIDIKYKSELDTAEKCLNNLLKQSEKYTMYSQNPKLFDILTSAHTSLFNCGLMHLATIHAEAIYYLFVLPVYLYNLSNNYPNIQTIQLYLS